MLTEGFQDLLTQFAATDAYHEDYPSPFQRPEFPIIPGMPRPSPRRRSDERRLGRFFNRNAYCREPDACRQLEGYRKYKKGWEVRLVLRDEDEVAIVCSLLWRVGLSPGKPFRKSRRWVVPVYGEEAVRLIRKWGEALSADS
jgi:hypothetical protein